MARWEGGEACGLGDRARDLRYARCPDGEATGAVVGMPRARLLQTEGMPTLCTRAMGLVLVLLSCLTGAGNVK